MKCYDPENNRLVFLQEENVSSTYWEGHWSKYDTQRALIGENRLITGTTGRFLPRGSRILEGGCGLGRNVYALSKKGFEAYGIDFASETLQKVREVCPDLRLCVGDVTALPFPASFFDGYWSVGVIEHFYNGFAGAAREMHRVLRPGGYLFISFPCLSPYRKHKIKRKKYGLWEADDSRQGNFYQFALLTDEVCSYFCSLGFRFVARQGLDGLKGLKDEIGNDAVRGVLQKLYNSPSLPLRAVRLVAGRMLAPFTRHCDLLVLQRK